MTPIQKAKEILDSFYDFIYQPGMNESWVDKWLESEKAAALLSGEDWIEMKEGNPLPDYDEPALWLSEDGNVWVDSLDKDGNPWIFEGFRPFPDSDLIKTTHWMKMPPLPEPPKP